MGFIEITYGCVARCFV